MRSAFTYVGSIGLACAVTGCGAWQDAPPSRVVQTLASSVSFDPAQPCTVAETNNIQAALAVADAQMVQSPAAMTACLREAVTSADNGDYAELIQSRLATPTATTFGCGNLGGGQASATQPTVPGEQIRFDRTFLAAATTAEVAAEMLRAVALEHQYLAPGGVEQPGTVPEHIRSCSLGISAGAPSPNGAPRGQMTGDAILQHVGTAGGAPRGNVCLPGYVVSGVTFFENQMASPANLVGFEATCLSVASGLTVSLPRAGATGTSVQRGCAAGEVLVGLRARTVNDVDEVTLVCQSLTSVQAGLSGPTTDLALVGGIPAAPPALSVVRMCPAGMAVRGIFARVTMAPGGDNLDRLQLLCESVNAPAGGDATPATLLGGALVGTGPVEAEEFCGDRGVLSGLYGHVTAANQLPSRLGGKCYATARVGGVLGFRAGAPNHGTAAVGGASFVGTSTFELACPAGMGVVGVSARTATANNAIASLRPRCADVGSWDSGAGAIVNGPSIGPTVGVSAPVNADCPPGEFVFGLFLRSEVAPGGSVRIDTVQPFCHHIGG